VSDPILDAIRQLRRAGRSTDEILAMNPYRMQATSPSVMIERMLGRNLMAQSDATRQYAQRPVQQYVPPQAPQAQSGPVPSMGVATPVGQRAVTPRMVSDQERAQIRAMAEQQSNDPMAIARMVEQGIVAASMSPTPIGDAASGIDAVIQLMKGNFGQAGLAAAGALPMIPNLRIVGAAFKDSNGRIWSGLNHALARMEAFRAGHPLSGEEVRGFLTHDGKFLTSAEVFGKESGGRPVKMEYNAL